VSDSVESSRASEKTAEGAISQWEEAYRLLEELRKRYDAAMHSIQAHENINTSEKPD
jgi:N-acetyl-anhydromuramyl-L-alanine amidase AmpD